MVLTAIDIIALIRGEKLNGLEMDFNDVCDADALSDIAEAAQERVSELDSDDEGD